MAVVNGVGLHVGIRHDCPQRVLQSIEFCVSSGAMEKKPPIIDGDGRLWVWSAACGYMLEPDPQAAWRREYLKCIRKRGGRRESLKIIAEACKAAPVVPVRKDRRRPHAPQREMDFSFPEPAPATKRKCRRVNRHVEGRRNENPTPYRTGDEIYAIKEMLHAAQAGICAICGEPLDINPRYDSLDHVIPRSLGGADALGNYVMAHRKCNGDKANDTPTGCEMIWLLMVNAKIGHGPIVY